MFGPPKKQIKPNTEQSNRSKTFKNKACHLQNKSLASQETKLDLHTPSSYQLGKDVTKHKTASQMCNRYLRQFLSQIALRLAFKKPLSPLRAGAMQFPVAADGLQPQQDGCCCVNQILLWFTN